MTDVVCIYFPTIMDGAVLRWYRTVEAAEAGNEILSASRDGIRVRGYIDDVPEPVMALARHVHRLLAADAGAPVEHLATHRRKHLLGREVEPIQRAEVTGA